MGSLIIGYFLTAARKRSGAKTSDVLEPMYLAPGDSPPCPSRRFGELGLT
jgi:hypothetical protein